MPCWRPWMRRLGKPVVFINVMNSLGLRTWNHWNSLWHLIIISITDWCTLRSALERHLFLYIFYIYIYIYLYSHMFLYAYIEILFSCQLFVIKQWSSMKDYSRVKLPQVFRKKTRAARSSIDSDWCVFRWCMISAINSRSNSFEHSHSQPNLWWDEIISLQQVVYVTSIVFCLVRGGLGNPLASETRQGSYLGRMCQILSNMPTRKMHSLV